MEASIQPTADTTTPNGPQSSPSKSARKRTAKKARAAAAAERPPSPTKALASDEPVPKEITASVPPPFGSLWQNKLWLHVLTFDNAAYAPLAFIGARPITSTPHLTLFLPRQLDFRLSAPCPLDFQLGQPEQDLDGKGEALRKFNTALFNMLCDRRLSCPRDHGAKSSADLEEHVTDDPLGFLLAPLREDFAEGEPIEPSVVDWTFVRAPWSKIDPQQTEALQVDSYLPAPFARRLCKESRLFRLIRARTDLDLEDKIGSYVPMLASKSYRGQVSYRQWFEGPDFGVNLSTLPADDVLLEVSVVRSPPRYTSPAKWQPLTGSASDERLVGVVPASVLRKSHLSDKQWKTFLLMPSFVRLLSDHVTAISARERLDLPQDIELDLLVKALTPIRANVGYDYERLEILGDAFLKMATSIHLFQIDPNASEGHCDRQRQAWIENVNLQRYALKNDLAGFLLVEPFNPPFWIPAPPYATTSRQKIFKDELSDCMEALLGAAWLHGPVTALKLGMTLQLPMGGTNLWSERDVPEKEFEGQVGLDAHLSKLEVVEETLGHRFKDRYILLRALTHTSFGQLDYERLEFLGDAIVDCFVVNRLYHLHPDMTPGQISLLKAVVVCNSSMAFLAAKKLKIVPAIRQSGHEASFQRSLQEMDRFDENKYQDSVWFIAPDKLIADLFESLVAAIFVDCGYHLDPVFSFLDRLLGPLIASLPADFPGDPVSELMRWAQNHHCREILPVAGDGEGMFACEIFFHDEHVGSASNPSGDVANQLASSRALDRLSSMDAGNLASICTCEPVKVKTPPKAISVAVETTPTAPPPQEPAADGQSKARVISADDSAFIDSSISPGNQRGARV